MNVYVLPLLVFFTVLVAMCKKIDAYSAFANGSKQSFELIFNIFPFILTVMIAVSLFRISGLCDLCIKLISPLFNLFGIPSEVCELVILRPFSGSGSIGILESILKQYGVDSYVGRCACVIMGSSETVFYVASIYFSQTKIKKLPYAIPISLFCTFLSTILACLLCKII